MASVRRFGSPLSSPTLHPRILTENWPTSTAEPKPYFNSALNAGVRSPHSSMCGTTPVQPLEVCRHPEQSHIPQLQDIPHQKALRYPRLQVEIVAQTTSALALSRMVRASRGDPQLANHANPVGSPGFSAFSQIVENVPRLVAICIPIVTEMVSQYAIIPLVCSDRLLWIHDQLPIPTSLVSNVVGTRHELPGRNHVDKPGAPPVDGPAMCMPSRTPPFSLLVQAEPLSPPIVAA